METRLSASIKRFRALDSLRGIAAFLVVIDHCYHSIPKPMLAAHADIDFALSLLWTGRSAVMMFFVLSGFVLALPYGAGKALPYGRYFIRRAFRLYPPYAFAVLLAALLCLTAVRHPEIVTGSILASHFLMTGVWESTALDGPLWSLIVEMRISVFFPLLAIAMKRFGWFAVAGSIALGYACFALNIARGASGEEINHIGKDGLSSLLLTLRYVPFFCLGIIAALRLERFRQILASWPMAVHVFCCALAVGFHVALNWLSLQELTYADIVYGVIASYIILCAVIFAPFARKLCAPALLWLGEISYSLYLVHWPVLYAVRGTLGGHMPYALVIAIALAAIFAVATAMHYLVEKPSMALGRKLTS